MARIKVWVIYVQCAADGWKYYSETTSEESAREQAAKLASRGRRALYCDAYIDPRTITV